MVKKKRLDQLLIERGLATDRKEAQALAMCGAIQVENQRVDKIGTLVAVDSRLEIRQPATRFASRGGEKLEGFLQHFGLDVSGLTCLDLGASTGGFTDCLLRRGVRRVYALDVGKGQLAWGLRQDPRVEVRDRVNVRHLEPGDLPETVELITVDLSFISLRTVLPRLRLFEDAELIALVKPQFEARREEVEMGGVVRDPGVREKIVARVRHSAQKLGFTILGEFDSRLVGRKGNREVFLYMRVPGQTPC